MNPSRPSLTVSDIFFFGLAYVLWLVNIAVCVVAVVQLRSVANVLWVVCGGDRYTLGLINQLVLLGGGFGAFVYVISIEGQYRASVARRMDDVVPSRWVDSRLGILLRRFAVTTAIPLGVVLTSLIVLEIALHIL